MSGYAQAITIDRKIPLSKEKKEEAKAKLNEQHKKNSKLVKGIFKNLECKGGIAQMHYREFPQDEIMYYTFEDGKAYDIPLGLAKHINNNCAIAPHDYLIDVDGNKLVGPNKSKAQQRYEFISTEYM
jgi:hypothetical protein